MMDDFYRTKTFLYAKQEHKTISNSIFYICSLQSCKIFFARIETHMECYKKINPNLDLEKKEITKFKLLS